jgi:hypothetical protein
MNKGFLRFVETGHALSLRKIEFIPQHCFNFIHYQTRKTQIE